MKANVKQIRKLRRYSNEVKKEIVHLFERGQYSVYQLEALYGMHKQTIYNWIYKYSTFNEPGMRVVEMKESSMNKVKELEKKVKELEQIVGQKQIKIDYLEKMIELAKTELEVGVKKNSNTPQSTGLEKTSKK